MKIVSLLPSATEIVCRLGLESHLVGVSHECDFPPTVQALPKLTRSRIDARAPSPEIHASIERLLEQTLGVYELDLELLKQLQPDCIVTQSLCDVCAVPFAQVEEASREVLGNQVRLISLTPARLDDVWQDVDRVAAAAGVPEAGIAFQREARMRTQAVCDRVRGLTRRTVLAIEWIDPVFIGGLWLPDMISLCGGEAILAQSGQPALTAGREQMDGINPDVVVVKPCGFKLDQLISEMDRLKNKIPWERWTAAREQRLFFVDGNAYFNRPGPRLLESLEILAYCVHPEMFEEFGERYTGGCLRLTPEFKLP